MEQTVNNTRTSEAFGICAQIMQVSASALTWKVLMSHHFNYNKLSVILQKQHVCLVHWRDPLKDL